jgi:hypothetical protein
VRLTGAVGWLRGPVVSSGVREEERRVRQRSGRAPTGGRRPHNVGAWFKLGFKSIQKYPNGSNEIRIPPKFGWFKRYLPTLQKFEINMVGKHLK